MKGIVLAGGTGSRLWPTTLSISKQLLPVYDKPMIYYPISTLMLAGVRDILIITTPSDQESFMKLLGDGSAFGVSFKYAEQQKPRGLADSLIIAEEFLAGDTCLLILGDNIFHGNGFGLELSEKIPTRGAHIFTYPVSNPQDFGVLEVDSLSSPKSVEEKPKNPKNNLAITGLYFFDNNACQIAKNITPSARGELEIISVIKDYLDRSQLTFTTLSRGVAWLDTGTPKALNDAGQFVRIIEERTGQKIACLEEIALVKGWISRSNLETKSKTYNNSYGKYLENL
jgi:glucose-1-phosphate thymidylyltransferase